MLELNHLKILFREKMKMEAVYVKSDESNMKDLMVTFAAKNEEANRKRSRVEIGSSMIETFQELIPKTISEFSNKHKKFKKSAGDAGYPQLGSREFKQSLFLCIKNLLQHSAPELINEQDFSLAPSLNATQTNKKLSKVLLLYQLALPMIRQYVVYDRHE